jgi:hypothetical protein
MPGGPRTQDQDVGSLFEPDIARGERLNCVFESIGTAWNLKAARVLPASRRAPWRGVARRLLWGPRIRLMPRSSTRAVSTCSSLCWILQVVGLLAAVDRGEFVVGHR